MDMEGVLLLLLLFGFLFCFALLFVSLPLNSKLPRFNLSVRLWATGHLN